MDKNKKRIAMKLRKANRNTSAEDILTPAEWAVVDETVNEMKAKANNRKFVMEWMDMTVLLPSGLLDDSEKVALINKVLERLRLHEQH